MFKYKSKFYFDKGLKIAVDNQLLRYYFMLIYKSPESTLGLGPPMRGDHISVTLPRIHGKDIVEKSKKYAGQPVEFLYDGDIIKGGSWFKNYWMKVECKRADEIKKELGIVEKNFLGYHLTIGNTKNRIVELYPDAQELSKRMNKGEFTVSEFREKMKEIILCKKH